MRKRTAAITLAAVAAAGAAVAGAAFALPAFESADASSPSAIAEAPDSGQSVIDWNQQLVGILGVQGSQPATVHPTRSFALLQTAEYNAVVSITHAAPPYRAAVPVRPGARPDVAADQAAHDVLSALYPDTRADLDARLTTELAAIPESTAKRDGIAVGAAAAKQVITLRADDGSATSPPPFTAGTAAGDYRPTPPKFAPPAYVGWGSVKPFVLDSPRQFRPTAPVSVHSKEYAAALAEVAQVGRDRSTTRTADQTVAGTFWSSAPIWITWNQIAQRAASDQHADLDQTVTAFAGLGLALADTTIALYDAKYDYRVWRPVTAIRSGGGPTDPALVADPSWSPLTPTAPDPSYPGAHSALSAAAAEMLTVYFGKNQPVTVSSAADPGVTRNFRDFASVADEAGLSRIWAGQHTRLDHESGQQLGRQVAALVEQSLPVPVVPAG